MFSGIIETTSTIVSAENQAEIIRILVKRPQDFKDLQVGDSIAVNGVCLTVEAFNESSMRFALGPETLRVTGWTAEGVKNQVVNLERSLRLGDRLHGHLVTGHVDDRAQVLESMRLGEALILRIKVPEALAPFLWPKGSVAVNGVSLTLNQVHDGAFTVGLIPETLKRTNLGNLQEGSIVNLEADNMARGLIHWVANMEKGLS